MSRIGKLTSSIFNALLTYVGISSLGSMVGISTIPLRMSVCDGIEMPVSFQALGTVREMKRAMQALNLNQCKVDVVVTAEPSKSYMCIL